MTPQQTIERNDSTLTLDDAMGVLFSKLDKGIDDMEQGRVIPSEQLFAELDALDNQ